MARLIKRASEKSGLMPGTLIYTGEKRIEKPTIEIFDYNSKSLEENMVDTIEECFQYTDKDSVTWINIEGLQDVGLIEKVGKHFKLHPLLLEDVLNTGQRPKLEDFGDYLFIVVKMLSCDKNGIIVAEHVSFVLGRNYVISFQEVPGDVFTPVRERIRKSKGRIRTAGTDYLTYALIDAIVDNYFVILERIGEVIEEMEEGLVSNPKESNLEEIHALKREMIFLRKAVWPMREVISGMERGESALIDPATSAYIRDLYDHTIQVIDTVETFRDLVSGMLDTYLSSVGNKMNEIMKVLTMMATIFIPLTFIAGIYGMNFEHMPELHKQWGYPAALITMGVIGLFMVVYFKRKKWL